MLIPLIYETLFCFVESIWTFLTSFDFISKINISWLYSASSPAIWYLYVSSVGLFLPTEFITHKSFIFVLSGSEYKEEGSYQYGRNAYYGITIGKKIPLKNEKFNLEIFVGGGSSQSNYKYYNKDEQRIFAITNYKRKFNKSGEELPYRGGLMLTYKL